MTHYSFGSGMAGCLYDFGPEYAASLDAALETLEELFDDYFEEFPEERSRFRSSFDEAGGCFYFEHPAEAGAQIAEISRHSGPMPEGEES